MDFGKEKEIIGKAENIAAITPADRVPETWFAEKGLLNPTAIYEPDVARQMLTEAEESVRRRAEDVKDPAFRNEDYFQESLQEVSELISYVQLLSKESEQRRWTGSEIAPRVFERSIESMQEFQAQIKAAEVDAAFEKNEKARG